MSKTKWTCETCKSTGTVEYPPHAGVYEVLELIRDQHGNTSPACSFDAARVKVEEVSPVAAAGEEGEAKPSP